MDTQDRRVIACNFAEATNVATKGALAYLRWPNWGWDNDRVPLLVRSRGGRWVQKWEAMRRLENFRFKTIPPGHPRYDDERVTIWQPDEDDLRRIQAACKREHDKLWLV